MEVAFRVFPRPNGYVYTEADFQTLKDAEHLFDYCQILMAMISKAGWDFLIEKFGIEGLYKADRDSGWYDCETLAEYAEWVEYERTQVAYDSAQDHEAITAFSDAAHFPAQ
ncbi:MAG: hypothetical protein IK134_13650 [Oscillospiraceae bacterium]|nr:hypothetical protein [Oscillospiraceae bacterium]